MTAGAVTRGMLDTSTVILLGRIEDPATLPDEAVISAITLAELSVGPHVAKSEDDRAARQVHLQQAESDFDVLAFDAESARAFGAVAYDALIAASAIAHGLPVYSCNPADFDAIPQLELRAVPHPDHLQP
jgi:tRNA(fMet)-specific endonuclease VapC